MGQGNAIAHLMPPPFYAYRYVVAKARAPEESIQDMINTCVDATPSADKRFKIEVMPGEYVEEIAMARWVDVVAPYGRAIIRPSSVTTAAVTMAHDCMLQGLMVDMVNISKGEEKTGIAIGNKMNCVIEDCWVTGGGRTDTGISDDTDATAIANAPIVRRCRIDGAATGYKKTNTGMTWFYDNRVTSTRAIRTVESAAAYDADDGYTNEKTPANNDTENDMNLFPAASLCNPQVNDAYYFGGAWPFQQLSLNVGTAGVGTWTIVWEYYDRETENWLEIPGYTDNTTGFHVSGTKTVTFTPPATWAPTDNGGLLPTSCYWIRARITVMPGAITTRPLGTQAWVTDAIDIDVDAGTLHLIETELMYEGTGGNVDVAAATAVVHTYANTLAGDGWRIGANNNAWVYSHNDIFTAVKIVGVGSLGGHMVAQEEPQVFMVHNGIKIWDAISRINTLGDASDTKRYTIRLFSGEYAETMSIPQYVDLIGESNETCVITATGDTCIGCNGDSKLRSFRVELLSATDGDAAIRVNSGRAYLEDLVIIVTYASGTNYGILTVGDSDADFHMWHCTIEAEHLSTYPIYHDGSGTSYMYDCTIFNKARPSYCVFIGEGDTMTSFNNRLRASGDGWYLTSHADTRVISNNDDFPSVVWSEDPGAGLFADLSGCRIYDCASGLEEGDWVYCDSNDHVALAGADALATMPTIGVINYKPTTTTCYVKEYGYYYDPVGNSPAHGDAFVAGQVYWISATAGDITTTMHPVWPQRAGVAVDTQRFKVLIGDNLGLVHCNEYETVSGHVAVDDWVYITTTNDEVEPTDASAAATMGGIGVCVQVTVGAPNDTLLIKLRGKYIPAVYPADAWEPSDDVYIADATVGAYNPGDITRTAPVGGIVQKVAEVKFDNDTDTLIYEIAD